MIDPNDIQMLQKHTEQAHQDLFQNQIIDQNGNLKVDL